MDEEHSRTTGDIPETPQGQSRPRDDRSSQQTLAEPGSPSPPQTACAPEPPVSATAVGWQPTAVWTPPPQTAPGQEPPGPQEQGQTAASGPSEPAATAAFVSSGAEAGGADNQATRAEPVQFHDAGWSEPAARERIGGYEILEVLGRGGMGVVYKARQTRLNRLVALKMILAGAHASPQLLARFQVEAKAVASLQHPNIVQIHEIGEHNGQHFLALEFVDGQPLDRLLAGKPQDPYLSAQLVATLGYAVQAAHDKGIVHRDLKPANILLQRPSSSPGVSRVLGRAETLHTRTDRRETLRDGHASPWGIPKITDFGLAKRMEEQDGNTVTGAIMGTPSYMAPEQASGKTDQIGPAADIYALGAILYELLTGRPPFAGVTPLETLRQVQTEEPVPPSRLQPRLPRDLETICLKALQKEPHQRYAAAADLAADLERFLAGEPILARPVSVWVLAWKWARRRPALASLIGVSVLAALTVVGIIVWSNAQLRASNVRLEAARQRAARNYDRSRKAVDELLRAVSNELEDAPLMEATRRRLLEKALGFYQEFLGEQSDDPNVRLELARTCGQVGDIYRFLADLPRSKEHYTAMIAMAQALPPALRDAPDFQRDLASAYIGRALVHKAGNELDLAVADARQALRIEQQLAQTGSGSPESAANLARCWYFLGVCLAATPDGLAEAEQAYREALQLQRRPGTGDLPPEEVRHLARTLNNLGLLLARTRRPAEAFAAFDEARRLQEGLVSGPAARPVYRRELARTYNNIAVLFQADPRRIAEAEAAYDQVRTLLEALVRDFPSVPDYRNDLGMCYANQAMLQRSLRQLDAALGSFERALAVQRALVRDFPEVADFRQRLARTLFSLGNCLRDLKREGEAAAAYREAAAVFDALLAELRAPEYLSGAAATCFALARLGYEKPIATPGFHPATESAACLAAGLWEWQRRQLLRQAVVFQEEAARRTPASAEYRNDLNNYLQALAQASLAIGDHASAAGCARRMAELAPEDPLQAFRAAFWLARCAGAVGDAGQGDPSGDYADEAVRLLQRAVRLGFKDAASLERFPFDVLRDHPEFQKLLRGLKEGTTSTIARR
jgi:serine/threonine protein kinase